MNLLVAVLATLTVPLRVAARAVGIDTRVRDFLAELREADLGCDRVLTPTKDPRP